MRSPNQTASHNRHYTTADRFRAAGALAILCLSTLLQSCESIGYGSKDTKNATKPMQTAEAQRTKTATAWNTVVAGATPNRPVNNGVPVTVKMGEEDCTGKVTGKRIQYLNPALILGEDGTTKFSYVTPAGKLAAIDTTKEVCSWRPYANDGSHPFNSTLEVELFTNPDGTFTSGVGAEDGRIVTGSHGYTLPLATETAQQ